MTDVEKKIILQFASEEITRDELYSQLPRYSDMTYLLSLYRGVIYQRDREMLCYLRMLPTDKSDQFKEVWSILLTEDWHFEHEDLISVFQYTFNKEQANINFLLKAFRNIPLYISQDRTIVNSYLQKIIYAIGAQPQPESLYALEELLSETDDQEVKSMISNQLEKRRSITGGEI